jgi:hypothetical protein
VIPYTRYPPSTAPLLPEPSAAGPVWVSPVAVDGVCGPAVLVVPTAERVSGNRLIAALRVAAEVWGWGTGRSREHGPAATASGGKLEKVLAGVSYRQDRVRRDGEWQSCGLPVTGGA